MAIIGILSSQGGSIHDLKQIGQEQRFINFYLRQYAKEFTKVYYFSYRKENYKISPNCFVIPNRFNLHRWIYAFLLPFIEARYFRQCSVLRIMQLTGEIPVIIAKLIYKIPFVATYGYPYEMFSRGERERLRPYLYKMRSHLALGFADKVIVTTKTLFDHVSKYVAQEKIILIPNTVDTALFKPQALNKERKTKSIIYVGRLSLMKNLKLLLDAVSLLNSKIKLTLIGDGPMKKLLMQQAREMGLDVEFKGIIINEELPLHLNSASIFVLPSVAEGHPKALLEAMSCGLACVATDVEGTDTVIQDGVNGLLCKLNVKDLAEKIEILLNDEKLAESLSRKAREFILENYDFNTVIEREITLLRGVGRQDRQKSRI